VVADIVDLVAATLALLVVFEATQRLAKIRQFR
jgi:hypothetical protein